MASTWNRDGSPETGVTTQNDDSSGKGVQELDKLVALLWIAVARASSGGKGQTALSLLEDTRSLIAVVGLTLAEGLKIDRTRCW